MTTMEDITCPDMTDAVAVRSWLAGGYPEPAVAGYVLGAFDAILAAGDSPVDAAKAALEQHVERNTTR